MRRSRLLAAGAALAVLAMPLSTTAGGASAGPSSRPPVADRVLIVLFDQMVPQYANQFRMQLLNIFNCFRNLFFSDGIQAGCSFVKD